MKRFGMVLAILLWSTAALALPSPETGAPEELAAWQSWVLHGYEAQYLCPETGEGVYQCLWPIRLSLDLTEEGGRFTTSFELRKESAIPLPGGPGAWPESLWEAGAEVPVLGSAAPQAWLPAGRHSLSGSFSWQKLPETIDLPLGFILDLRVNGQSPDFPALEVDYQRGRARLWLRKTEEAPLETALAEAADGLALTVNRLVEDSQPMMIQSRFRLAVSGRPREVLLTGVLLPETRATLLSSPLPSQLTAEGLRVRVKPGIYDIFLNSRSLTRSESLGPVAADSPVNEYWAFLAQPQLRLAEISGAEQIDASQADMYGPWSSLPIYALPPGASMKFTTLRRGDPEPAPDQLRLARECWLDYDGGGLSCRDRLSGAMSRQWHLSVDAPFTLTQASLSGQPQVITWQTDSNGEQAPGLQLREGRLDLQADLRIDDFDGRFPASGWDHQVDTGGQQLNLPPGYRLLHASGADVLGAWTGNWGALDFFIILIITIALGKLYGRAGGLLTLAALILCYHEPGSPRLVFLPLLASAALLRLLPTQGKAVWLVRALRNVCALALVVLAGLFVIGQARTALYPQLDFPLFDGIAFPGLQARYAAQDRMYHEYESYAAEPAAAPEPDMEALMMQAEAMDAMDERMMDARAAGLVPSPKQSRSSRPMSKGMSMDSAFANHMVRLTQAPDAKVQNSAPRPAWSWKAAILRFNETVTADQQVRLYLAGPTANRLLGLLRLALMTALSLIVLELWRFKLSTRAVAVVAALVCMSVGLGASPAAAATGNFPDTQMLNEYRQRLLTRPALPEPGLAELRLSATAEGLTLIYRVSTAEETVLALPSLDRDIFRPESVRLDSGAGEVEQPLVEDQGRWLTLIPAGTHSLVVTGRLKKASASFQAFQINFPESARPRKVTIEEGSQWQVEGLEEDGQLVAGALYLTAQAAAPAPDSEDPDPAKSAAEVILDPFFLVQRTLSLGLEWRVHTTVRRVTPAGAPVSLKLPLLPGEKPIGGLRPEGGLATVNFDPQAEEVSWESSLDISPELELMAADGPWTESWSLDVSPIWRVELTGLTPIHNVNQGFWQPQWRPWPGETLRIAVDRPSAVPGSYLAIDRGVLSVAAGENSQVAELSFQVRTSQAGPYSFTLPEGIEVREFTVDGSSVPLSLSDAASPDKAAAPSLTAPLSVGEHAIRVSWTADQPLSAVTRTPVLDLGAPGANLDLSLVLPENRWILWTWGPLQGPAVQFWPFLAVLWLAAVLLSRAKTTPLGRCSWFLLGVGLIQLHIFGALAVAGWLLMLGRRRTHPAEDSFNFTQILLTFWTIAALVLIYKGIENGLLQNPDMLIAGSRSYGQELTWFTDRVSGPWPSGAVLSVSTWFYKALMLAWSLWLAVSLVRWLKWGWEAFSSQGLWKKSPPRAPKSAPQSEPSAKALLDQLTGKTERKSESSE